ncbi:hypothetical protein GCM10023187_08410 [Nibrella viscosa]|uniref:DUF4142 domain-containing protein n=1 Tax=Nibrella viscosa TaxID=1084524 RepID=A0ABP8JZ38_9BACT
MKKASMVVGLMLLLVTAGVSVAQQINTRNSRNSATTTIGVMSREEFRRLNERGAAQIASVNPTRARLSQADQDLMMQVAIGSMMQLEISRLAVRKASTEAVRQLAQAEVEEQAGLLAKLKELARAKGSTLPAKPDAQIRSMISRINGMSGAAFDQMYMQESGVKGHENLDRIMAKVESNASDESLKNLAEAAHPLVKTHLQVARETLGQKSNNGTMSR